MLQKQQQELLQKQQQEQLLKQQQELQQKQLEEASQKQQQSKQKESASVVNGVKPAPTKVIVWTEINFSILYNSRTEIWILFWTKRTYEKQSRGGGP